VPLAPEERVEIPGAEALHRGRKLALEREPAHLAVRDDVEAGVLLQRERVVDRTVLDLLERRVRERAAVEALTRLEQLRRPQKAAHDVGSGQEHADSLRRPLAFPAALGARLS
jgi:hypothetical protein